MRVAIGGDVHGYASLVTEHLTRAFNDGANTYIQLGDWNLFPTTLFYDTIQAHAQSLDMQVYFLDGNHDHFPSLPYSIPDPAPFPIPNAPNISYLPRNTRLTLPDDPHQTVFHILGGAHSIDEVFRTPHRDIHPEEDITQEDIDRALLIPKDAPTHVLLTHDCPANVPNPITSDPLAQLRAARIYGHTALHNCHENQRRLQTITDHLAPTLHFHGHYHVAYSHHNPTLRRTTIGLNQAPYPDSYYLLETDTLHNDNPDRL